MLPFSGHDLSSNTTLKLVYLEASVMALEPTDPNTRQHLSTVLNGLGEQLSRCIATGKGGADLQRMKLLSFAVTAILNKA